MLKRHLNTEAILNIIAPWDKSYIRPCLLHGWLQPIVGLRLLQHASPIAANVFPSQTWSFARWVCKCTVSFHLNFWHPCFQSESSVRVILIGGFLRGVDTISGPLNSLKSWSKNLLRHIYRSLKQLQTWFVRLLCRTSAILTFHNGF